MSDKKGIPPTVGNFFLLLSSKLTQYDVAESKREAKRGRSNIYRLGHLLGASQKAEAVVLAHHEPTDAMTPEIAKLFVGALAKNFTYNRIKEEFDLSPVRNVVKQLDAYLSHGKNPSLVGSGNVEKKPAPATKKTPAYVGSGAQVFIPEWRIKKESTKPTYFSVPLRGVAYIMGVWDSATDNFVGYVEVEDLGHPDVKSWLAAAKNDPRMIDPIKKFM